VLWERIVFCYVQVVVASSVCNHLILEWIIAHCFLRSMSLCMYSFDNVSSSSVDKFACTPLKSISSALPLPVSRGRHAMFIDNFSHASDVTWFKVLLKIRVGPLSRILAKPALGGSQKAESESSGV